MSEADKQLEALRKRVAEWTESPEGKRSLIKTAESVSLTIEQMKKIFTVDHELMRKPMDI